MTLTDASASFDTLNTIGGVLVVAGILSVFLIFLADTLRGQRIAMIGTGSLLIIGFSVTLVGFIEAENMTDRLNAEFSEKLLDTYGATSDKTYAEIRDDEGSGRTAAIFDRDGELTPVIVVFSESGELTFLQAGTTEYQPIESGR